MKKSSQLLSFASLLPSRRVVFWPTRAAKSWRSVKVTDFERRQMAAIRKELDEEYEFKCYPILLDSHRPRQQALGPSDRQRSGRSLL
jgi:hypothetical protein